MDDSSGTIVVGVDGSRSSRGALDWAVDQAVAEHRALTLVHGLGQAHPTWADAHVSTPRAQMSLALQAGEELVAAQREHVRARATHVEVRTDVQLVDPRTLLLEHSARAHLVVVGSRGRGPVASLLLGSVGAAVVRHTRCPVVVHRPTHGDSRAAGGRQRYGVLVACDARAESAPVLDFAFRQAELSRLPLTVLHCWSYGYDSSGQQTEVPAPGDLEGERLEVGEAVAGFAEKYPGVPVDVELVHGLTGMQVVQAGASEQLVVVGLLHRGSPRHDVLMPISLAVVEHATTPVAVVPVTAGPAPT